MVLKDVEEISLNSLITITYTGMAIVGNSTGIVADLHMGFEEYLSEGGIALPHFELNEAYAKFSEIFSRYDLDTIVLAGDFKHDFSKNSHAELAEIPELIGFLQEYVKKVVLVKGNHDNFLSSIVTGHNVDLMESYTVKGIKIIHGDRMQSDAKNLIIGHEHPSITLRDSVGVSYRMPVYLYFRNENVLVIPAFSVWTYGTDLLHYPLSSPVLSGLSLDDAEVYAIYEKGIAWLATIGRLKILGSI